jgi:hypothetical protein
MEDSKNYIHDAYISMAERVIKRLWLTIILLILVVLASNVGWLIYESQFEVVETSDYSASQEVDNCSTINDGIRIDK